MGWMAEFQMLAGEDFSLLHNIQTSFGAHPASYPSWLATSSHAGTLFDLFNPEDGCSVPPTHQLAALCWPTVTLKITVCWM
jgi:hypothetical protein